MKEYTSKEPVFSESIQVVETTDPAHADNVNAAPKQLLQNDLVLHDKIKKKGRVLIGSSGTPLEKNDTLFVIDEDDNQEFKGASFTNVVHEDGKAFVQNTGIISGDLTVSDQYQDAVFLAKI